MSIAHETIDAVDLFCGAGGSSTGLVHAARARKINLSLLAINHWRTAVDTHSRNHPWARHLCADIATIDPNKAIPGGHLDILIASPECTHHSNARGGKPKSEQSRASAWHVVHWAERLRPKNILVENVREFETWGPLDDSGQAIKTRRGETFQAFVAALRSLGYTVEWRILNAADYGDATSRRRLFLQAMRSGGPIVWPEATHSGHWRPAREIIDWTLRGESILRRKRPLAKRTLDRIEAGLRKFGGEPFIAVLRGTQDHQAGSWAKSVDEPLGTISAGGVHAAICEPFIVQYQGGQGEGKFLRMHSVEKPLPTQTTENRYALCEPFIIPFFGEREGQSPRVHVVDNPLPTVTGQGAGALCEPFILGQHSEGAPRAVSQPMPTICTESRGIALVQPFLTKYYGSGAGAKPVSDPLDTITSKDRFALVEPTGMDIYFRMLQPHELAAAMGFDDYQFSGSKTDKVRQIGNAVAVRTAEALCGAMLDSNTNGSYRGAEKSAPRFGAAEQRKTPAKR